MKHINSTEIAQRIESDKAYWQAQTGTVKVLRPAGPKVARKVTHTEKVIEGVAIPKKYNRTTALALITRLTLAINNIPFTAHQRRAIAVEALETIQRSIA